MKRKSVLSLTVVMAVVLLFSLFVVPVASTATGGTDRPFKATLAGAAHWEFPGDWLSNCAEVTTLTEAAGQATHMGRIEMFGWHCPAEPLNVNDGRLALIAANGDELYGTYNYDPASESNEIPVTLNGGTGSFAGASGAAILTYEVIPQFIEGCDPEPDPFACFDFSVSWPWFATLTGTISY
ncbi:MAG: hypothetical protein RRC07_02210 [Anaerolineae bacterium]|nr:hypothetical protein [Anaerolineae bacterium]